MAVKIFWFPSLLLLCLLSGISVKKVPECHETVKYYHQYLGTKSAYTLRLDPFEDHLDNTGAVCHYERIWMMVRHGTRNPSKKVITLMKERLTQLRDLIIRSTAKETKLCDAVISNLKAWKCEVNENDEKFLTTTGEREMNFLAQNFQSYFPDVFPGNYSESVYLFRYTPTQRTAASARAFVSGLFGNQMSRYVRFVPAGKKDPVLRFYKLCKRWLEKIDDNPEALWEKDKFELGPEIRRSLADISRRLNLNFTLTYGDAKLMYVTCGFETAWYPSNISPWCGVFSEEDFKVMEYAEDLKYYWNDGYGHNLTYLQACPAIRDMTTRIIPHLIRPGTPSTTVYFSHSGTMLKMLAYLGLYKDSRNLKHDEYQLQHSRLWRVSYMDSFGSNLAFVLTKCKQKYYVLTLNQEKPIHLPGCEKYGDLCPLDVFYSILEDSIVDCRFGELCF